MTRPARRIFAVALMLFVGVAHASDWQFLRASHDGKLKLYLDVSSVRATVAERRVWAKFVFLPHTNRQGKKWVQDSVVRMAFNCEDETNREEAVTMHYADGSSDIAPDYAFPTSWTPVAPDTLAEDAMRFVCASKSE